MSNTKQDEYYRSGQYNPDPKRPLVWREIIRFLCRYIPENSVVADLGAGYCDFINQISASKKYAVDPSPELSNFAAKDVIKINQSAWNLYQIPNASVDVVHSSNLLEHFTDEELSKTIGEIKRVLKKGGKVILIQPNYSLQPEHYFDDHTHKKIFNDASLKSFLVENGFKIILKMPRFLPQEVKNSPSFIPQSLLPLIVRAYIYSPFKPFAGQMLFVAEKK